VALPIVLVAVGGGAAAQRGAAAQESRTVVQARAAAVILEGHWGQTTCAHTVHMAYHICALCIRHIIVPKHCEDAWSNPLASALAGLSLGLAMQSAKPQVYCSAGCAGVLHMQEGTLG
jgi:hypothetical protein